MNILVAGGTGFVGRYLVPALLKSKQQVSVIGRNKNLIARIFPEQVIAYSWEDLDTLIPSDFDVVINLVGETIAHLRWTETVKNKIIHSRVLTTQKLAEWCANAAKPPHLYNASAVSIYGLYTGLEDPPFIYNETDVDIAHFPLPFLTEVAERWENAAEVAVNKHIPVTFLRFAVILKRGEGVLKALAPSFYCGMGAKLGSGKQPYAWIHIEDVVAAIQFLLKHPEITGAVNVIAPNEVTQYEMATILAKTMKRPLLFSLPSWLLKLILDEEVADELLLKGTCAVPQKLLDAGFKFKYPFLKEALEHDW